MTTTSLVPDVELNNGVRMPQLGLGVFEMDDAQIQTAILTAFDLGYRSIDTAAVYQNEEAVGKAIRASGLDRSEIFVTTKLWGTDHARDRSGPALDASLARLGLDYVDLYLIHWPESERGQYVEAWDGLERLLEAERTRAIGVCNFLPSHLGELAALGYSTPAVNQIELHPMHQQQHTRGYDDAAGIITESWAPLARGRILESETIVGIARELGVTPGQVTIRWHLQSGLVVIPKSQSPARLAENFDVFGFALSEDQMSAIAGLDEGYLTDPSLLRFQ